MKVLHCIYDDPANPWVGGGGAVRLFEIYRRLAGRVDATLATGSFPGARDETAGGVRYLRLGARRPYAWSRLTYGRAATRLLAAGGYDAAVFDFSAYTPIRVPRGRPVGLMLGQLAGPTSAMRWGRAAGAVVGAWERRQLGSARWICAVSAWLLEQARPLAAPDAELSVVGAGVGDEFFAVPRREEGFLLFYGRFDVFQKGIDILLDAAALLARDRPGLCLKLAGRGRDEGRLEGMVAQRGIAANVEIVPNPSREAVLALMAGAAAVVMPSRFEGFGMVAAEAMAAAVPVVATAADALPEVVGDAGVLVFGPGPAPLARAVAELLDDPARRARLSAAGRERARRYSWDRVADEHLQFLQRIARGRVPSPLPGRS